MSVTNFTQGTHVRLFSIFLAFYPVLCIYKAWGNFTIGDVLLMLFVSWQILIKRGFKNTPMLFFIYGAYIFMSMLMNVATTADQEISKQANDAIIRGIKLLFYVFSILCLSGSRIVDIAIFKKWMVYIGIGTAIFLFYQYAMFFMFGKIVLGQIPGFEIHLKEYTELDYETIYGFNFRPCSIFLEPAMLSQYVIVSLSLLLFDKNESKYKSFYLSLLILAIILSTSGQGILYLTIVFLLYSVFFLKKKSIAVGLLFVIAFFTFFGYETIEPMRFAIDRLLFGEAAADARLGSYLYCTKLESWDMIFGKGYGCIPDGKYLAGAAYVWYGAGIVGLILAIGLFVSTFIRCKLANSRIILALFFVMFWGTALFYNYMFWWFFTMIIAISFPALQSKEVMIKKYA